VVGRGRHSTTSLCKMDISALLEEDVEDDMDLSDEEEVAALTEIKAAAVRAPSQKLFYDSNVSPAVRGGLRTGGTRVRSALTHVACAQEGRLADVQEHNAAVGICKAIREKKTHLIRQLVRYVGKPVCLEVLEETLKIEVRSPVVKGLGSLAEGDERTGDATQQQTTSSDQLAHQAPAQLPPRPTPEHDVRVREPVEPSSGSSTDETGWFSTCSASMWAD
jgi:hypothetical protein